jgi:RNA polymerase sigma-70 factor (ECF subfamily)
MDCSILEDAALLRLIARGQTDALDELYKRYNRLVFSLALAMVSDRAVAAEITLDVFTDIWRRADTYRAERAKVSTWLTAIARHRAIDALRRSSARPESQSVSWDELPTPDPYDLEDHVERILKRERVRAAIAQLPLEQRQTLALAYFKGYTQREIAELLDQPLGTVKTRIRMAMQKLRRLLAEERPPADQSKSVSSAYNTDETG